MPRLVSDELGKGIGAVTLSSQEYEAIIGDGTKLIAGDIQWEGRPNAPARRFHHVIVDTQSVNNCNGT